MQYLVQADTGSQMRATLTRNDTGEAVPLTDCTVVLKVRERGPKVVLFSVFGQELTAGDYLLGIVTFAFASNLDELDGYYDGEIEVTYPGGAVESVYEIVRFQIRKDF
jgi:hypothetical protein